MTLTDHDILSAVRTLAAAYDKRLDEDATVRVWRLALDGIDAPDLREAVRERIRSDAAYFPKPGQIRTLALQHRARMGGTPAQAEPAHDGLTCPACGERLRVLPPEDQVYERWDDEAGTQVNALLEASCPRLGILHDLAIPHGGLPVTYGRYRLGRRMLSGDRGAA